MNLSIPVCPKEDKKQFYNDKKKYCLTKEEGEEYINLIESLKILEENINEIDERLKNKELYAQLEKIKKLKVSELEKLLVKNLKKAQYIKLRFLNIETSKNVIISFRVQDDKEGRENYKSEKQLLKQIEKTLLKTNWRLMSDGVHYQLGVLEGRLKGVDTEEDLVKLVNKSTS